MIKAIIYLISRMTECALTRACCFVVKAVTMACVIRGRKPSETFLVVCAWKELEILPRILTDDSCDTSSSH
jgi:hypothetical protein